MPIGRFFAMVGALCWCPTDGKYLVLCRSADKDFAGGAWECVTGRVDQGEGFPQAVRREVYEELGVEAQVDFVLGTAHFYRGETRPENEMVGVVFHCTLANPAAIQTSAEHAECRWITARESAELFPPGYWLVDLIARAELMRPLLPAALLDYFRQHGFE